MLNNNAIYNLLQTNYANNITLVLNNPSKTNINNVAGAMHAYLVNTEGASAFCPYTILDLVDAQLDYAHFYTLYTNPCWVKVLKVLLLLCTKK